MELMKQRKAQGSENRSLNQKSAQNQEPSKNQEVNLEVSPVKKFKVSSASVESTVELCSQITLRLQGKITQDDPFFAAQDKQRKQKILEKLEKKSPLNEYLFADMWRLAQIFELNQTFEAGDMIIDPKHAKVVTQFTAAMFKGLFCQKAFTAFQKGPLNGKNWLEVFKDRNSRRLVDINFDEVFQLIKNDAQIRSQPGYMPEKNLQEVEADKHFLEDESKDFYEVLVNLAIYIIGRITGPVSGDQKNSGFESHEFHCSIVNQFVRHLRSHETQDQKRKEKSGKSLSSKNKQKNDILTCLPSALTFLKLLNVCEGLKKAVKERELINKLLGLLPQFFDFNFAPQSKDPLIANLNLNALILSQSKNLGYGIGDGGSTNQLFTGVVEAKNSEGTMREIARSSAPGSPSKVLQSQEDQDFGTGQHSQTRQQQQQNQPRLSNLRASSEPPTVFNMKYAQGGAGVQNNHVHSQEEIRVISDDPEQTRLMQLNLNQQAAIASATRSRPIQKVPPILVNKININGPSGSISSAHPAQGAGAQQNFQSTQSSIVMNNFFNMSHGYQGNNPLPQNQSSAQKSSQYKYISQPTLAKSRLTRRQQSMTKTSEQNLSSTNLVNQLSASHKNRQGNHHVQISKTNVVVQSGNQQQQNQMQTQAKQRGASLPHTSADPTHQQLLQDSQHPYNDTSVDQRNQLLRKPKIPMLNITKVLQDSTKETKSNLGGTQNLNIAFGSGVIPHTGNPTTSLMQAYLQDSAGTPAQRLMQPRSSQLLQTGDYKGKVGLGRDGHNTRSSLSPASGKMRKNNFQEAAGGFRDTESNFDDVNGSFVIENLIDDNQGVFENAEEKLKNLAIQLGEACLTNDLAFLMSQKRDQELVESARKIVKNQPFLSRQWTVAGQNDIPGRSHSHQITLGFPKKQHSLTNNTDGGSNVIKLQNVKVGDASFKNQKVGLVQRANEILSREKDQSVKYSRIRYRVVILNIIDQCLQMCSNVEARFLRQPVKLLYQYLESSYFRETRNQRQIRNIRKGVDEHQALWSRQKMQFALQQSSANLGGTGGSQGISEAQKSSLFREKFDNEMFVMRNDGSIIKLVQLAQAELIKAQKSSVQNGQTSLEYIKQFSSMSIDSSNHLLKSIVLSERKKLAGNEASKQSFVSSQIVSNSQRNQPMSLQHAAILANQNIFPALCLPEVRIVTRLLNKFQFVNEDNLRSQILNQFTFGAMLSQNMLNGPDLMSSIHMAAYWGDQDSVNQFRQYPGISAVPSRVNSQAYLQGTNRLSASPSKNNLADRQSNLDLGNCLDEPLGNFLNSIPNNDNSAIGMANSPNLFWANNGIAYEILGQGTQGFKSTVSGAALVSRESIRKKLDQVLYGVNRRIRFIFSQQFELTSFELASQLKDQVIILSTYLEQQSRSALHQVIDVIFEPLLMIKKTLIDIALNTNILVLDFSRQISYLDLLMSAKETSAKLRESNQNQASQEASDVIKKSFIIRQQKIRELFSEFLLLCSVLLKGSHSQETLKLFNETLIFDELWQEAIKAFTITLFLSDLVGPLTSKDLNHFQSQQLQDLRGTNLVNLDEQLFFKAILQLREPKIFDFAKNFVHQGMLAAINILGYLTSVTKFFQIAIDLYFPVSFDSSKKKDFQQEGQNTGEVNRTNGGQNLVFGQIGQQQNLALNQNYLKQNHDKEGNRQSEKLKGSEKTVDLVRQQKYWKHVIRKVLYQLMYLITQPNGLLFNYVQNNATNYCNNEAFVDETAVASQRFQRKKSQTKPSNDPGLVVQQTTPLNLKLTKATLSFIRRTFALPERFTKYVFDDELLLFYIRTSYISFVKLYNKNFITNQTDQSDNILKQTPGKREKLTGSDSFVEEDEEVSPLNKKLEIVDEGRNQKILEAQEIKKQASITLCKKHLKCLFAIARNRNEDTRRKLFQFKILQFLLQEIGLEFEVQQRREKFLKLSKEQRVSEDVKPQDSKTLVSQASHPNDTKQKAENVQKFDQQNQDKPPIQVKKFVIPPLKVGGLTLSTLVGADGKTQEEKDVDNLVKDGKKEKNQDSQKHVVPPLTIQGIQVADAITEEVNHSAKVSQLVHMTTNNQEIQDQPQNETNQNNQAAPPISIKKKPFIPPLLGAKNLGMSTLIQENGKTQEEMDVEKQVQNQKKPQQRPIESSSSDEAFEQVPPQNLEGQEIRPKKKMPFIPPLLGAKNLGMSTLVKENGKTQEELDVESQVKQNKMQSNLQMSQEKKKKITAEQPQHQDRSIEPTQAEQRQPVKRKMPFIPPLTAAKDLGMSTLKKDNGMTQEEMDVAMQVSQSKNQQQVSNLNPPPNPVPEPEPADLNSSVEDLQMQVHHSRRSGKHDDQKKRPPRNNNDGDSSDSEEYYAELARLKEEKAKQIQQTAAAPKRFIPALSMKGLGLSTLQTGGKTQEEIDVENLVQANKKGPNVPSIQKQMTLPEPVPVQVDRERIVDQLVSINDSQILRQDPPVEENRTLKDQTSSATSNALKAGMQILKKAEVSQEKQAKLQAHRKGLIQRSRSKQRANLQTDVLMKSQNAAAIGRRIPNHHVYQQDLQNLHPSELTSPQNAISGFNESMQANSIQKAQKDRQMLSPPSATNQGSQRSKSVNSTGSLVGRNQVFVPHLNFPGDINADPAERRKVHKKPKDDSRFQLKKSNTSQMPDGKKKMMGKKSRMLDIQPQQTDQSQLQIQTNVTLQQVKDAASDQSSPKHRRQQAEQSDEATNPSKAIIKRSITHKQQAKHNSNSQTQQTGGVDEQKVTGAGCVNSEDLDTVLEKLSAQKQNPLLSQNKKSLGYSRPDQQTQKGVNVGSQPVKIEVTEQVFYMKERSVRPIYQDDELHVLMLSLMMCLLLKPARGTLDELYCSQFPIDNDSQNVLYLLHFHLSHQENQRIVPNLLKMVEKISPPLAGIRLLKLLCPSLFDLSLYNNGKGWKKLASGQYGVVYECRTKFAQPQRVAIKQMSLPQSIEDRCVLHDIFTEITCLEEFRLEPCVTDLFDYGVDGQNYYIVMKRYSKSLREWRLNQKPNLMDNLSVYLSIYREVLKAFKIIQSHNVTHYDIKCDNILIDFKGDEAQQLGTNFNSNEASGSYDKQPFKDTAGDQGLRNNNQSSFLEEFSITVGDFGTCHMYSNQKDEYNAVDRGTANIKSPEMVALGRSLRKDTDKYDRRKQVGTSRLSDIWSLGCLFYELLTGDVLYDADDYIQFFVRLTNPEFPLFEDGRLDKINNNVYLIDFLKYILVRDQRLRPTIDSVIKRFEHVHALLVATSSTANHRFDRMQGAEDFNLLTLRGSKATLTQVLQQAVGIMQNSAQFFAKESSGKSKGKSIVKRMSLMAQGSSFQQNQLSEQKEIEPFSGGQRVLDMPEIMQIMQNVFISSERWLGQNLEEAVRAGITHVIMPQQLISQRIQDRFDVLLLPESMNEACGGGGTLQTSIQSNKSSPNAFLILPTIMDFLRKVALFKGKVLFVESSADWFDEVVSSESHKQEEQAPLGPTTSQIDSQFVTSQTTQERHIIKESLLMSLSSIYQTSAYETYTLIKSQNLFFQIESSRLEIISKWSQLVASMTQYLATYPKFSCICGASVLIIKRQFANYQHVNLINCQCSPLYKNVDQSQCPSPGCQEYVTFLKRHYRKEIDLNQVMQDDHLLWGFFEEEDFVLGPNFSGVTDNYLQRQLVATVSKTIDKNTELVITMDKNRNGTATAGGNHAHSNFQTNNPNQNNTTTANNIQTDLISRSSATRRNQYRNHNPSGANHKDSQNNIVNMVSGNGGSTGGGVLNSSGLLNQQNGVGGASGFAANTASQQRWKLYKCSACQVWTHAHNEYESRYAVLLNNRVKERQLNRLGLLAGQDDDIDMNDATDENRTVRVPILSQIKIKMPF